MPRVEDRLLKSVIYLYKSRDDADRGRPGGSGFLVGEPTTTPGVVFLFAVTNAHVAKDCPVIRTGGPPDRRVIDLAKGDWYEHAAGDDLAVTPVGFVPENARDYYLDYIPRDWFVTPENFTEATMDESDYQPLVWPFGPGDEVVMLGRFLGHDGTLENRPTARFGHLAMGTTASIAHSPGFEQSSFLIECRSLTGYSGSPVFIFRAIGTISAGLLPLGAEVKDGKRGLPRLLGIDWGHLNRVTMHDYAVDWTEKDVDRTLNRSSGMMVAVPAWRLAELLDSKGVQDVKRKAEAEAIEASKDVTLDFESSDFHAFEVLARRLTSVPKAEVDELRDRQNGPVTQ